MLLAIFIASSVRREKPRGSWWSASWWERRTLSKGVLVKAEGKEKCDATLCRLTRRGRMGETCAGGESTCGESKKLRAAFLMALDPGNSSSKKEAA